MIPRAMYILLKYGVPMNRYRNGAKYVGRSIRSYIFLDKCKRYIDYLVGKGDDPNAFEIVTYLPESDFNKLKSENDLLKREIEELKKLIKN